MLLPPLDGVGPPVGNVTSMTSGNDEDSECAAFGHSRLQQESPELLKTAQQSGANFAAAGRKMQRRKTRLGLVVNQRELSPKELHEHRVQLQIKRNRTLRLAEESKAEEKKRQEGGTTAMSIGGIFANTEAATGTYYSVQSTHTGPRSQWQKDGRFETTQVMPEALQKKALMDYTFDSTEVEDFLNDPRLLALAHIKFMNGEDKEVSEAKNV